MGDESPVCGLRGSICRHICKFLGGSPRRLRRKRTVQHASFLRVRLIDVPRISRRLTHP